MTFNRNIHVHLSIKLPCSSLLLMRPFIEFDCSRYRYSSERVFSLNLEIQGKLRWLSNQFVLSIVFNRSKFDIAKFDSTMQLYDLRHADEKNIPNLVVVIISDSIGGDGTTLNLLWSGGIKLFMTLFISCFEKWLMSEFATLSCVVSNKSI